MKKRVEPKKPLPLKRAKPMSSARLITSYFHMAAPVAFLNLFIHLPSHTLIQ